MKKLRLRKAILILTILLLIPAILFCPIKQAVKVEFVDEQYDIRDFEGQKIRLLCQYQQVTGSIWYAGYIEVENNTFAKLNPGTSISLSSRGQPTISGEYTSDRYGKTEVIIEGIIPESEDWPEAHMKISKWDVVAPVDTGWFTRYGYLNDHLIVLDLILP